MVAPLTKPASSLNGKKSKMAKTKTSRHTEPDANREKALDQAVSHIERSFGKGSIMRLADDPSNIPEGISTGAISLARPLLGPPPRGQPRRTPRLPARHRRAGPRNL